MKIYAKKDEDMTPVTNTALVPDPAPRGAAKSSPVHCSLGRLEPSSKPASSVGL